MAHGGTQYTQQIGFTYTIKKEIATLGENGDEKKELNLISYNRKPARYDIRTWSYAEGSRHMLRGITLSKEEAIMLRDALIAEFPAESSQE